MSSRAVSAGGRPMHTYSIVARDPQSGEMGVAVQSHWFSVGSLCPWAEAGAGAIATQSLVNVSYGPRGLALLKAGKSAGEVVETLVAADDGRAVRQLAVVDAQGNVAAHTGAKCIPEAGHATGAQFSVQANMMLNDRVWPGMVEAFAASTGPLAERMVCALAAAQEAGGDVRGKQSAALLLVRAESTGEVWTDRLVDLRVEDHCEPLVELDRLLRLQRAYDHMNEGDGAMERGDVAAALDAYRAAEEMFPDNLEMRFWHAVSLVNVGRTGEALPILHEVFRRDPNWRKLVERLPRVDLLSAGNGDLRRILDEDSGG